MFGNWDISAITSKPFPTNCPTEQEQSE